MPVTVYKSTDASAPVLNGVAGSLITVLDAVLVNGYGAKAAAGWTKPFSGANQAAYRTITSGTGIGIYLQVTDTAPNTPREARLRGFETMSSVTVGLGAYPTTVQFPNGLLLRKSVSADATARPWIIIADGRTVYIFVLSGDYGVGYAALAFGEFFSLKSGDAYRAFIIGKTVEQIAGTPTSLASNENLMLLSALTTTTVGHYVARSFSEAFQSAVLIGKHGNAAHSASNLEGVAVYPNPVDGGLYLANVWLHETVSSVSVLRGRLRGFWHYCHPPGTGPHDGDTWSGTGPLAGKTFIAITPAPDGSSTYVMETSDTWETN